MAKTFTLDIVTPSGVVFTGDVEHVRAPGVQGSFGVLDGHTPFITPLEIGEIDVRIAGGEDKVFATSGGIADVSPGKFLLLVETAEDASAIDLERAETAKQRSIERLMDVKPEDVDKFRLAKARAENRLRIARKAKGGA